MTRPLRKDAADNRERVLAAATTVFTRDGVDACIESVAREAGIGMGTVYRRFPTKRALIDELVDSLRDDILTAAEAALRDSHEGDGLERYLRAAGALLAQRRSFLPMVWRPRPRSAKVARVRSIVTELLTQAQLHAVVSADVTTTDITAVLWSMRGIMEMTHEYAPDAWMRHLDFALAGMRVGGLRFSQPALTLDQIDELGEESR